MNRKSNNPFIQLPRWTHLRGGSSGWPSQASAGPPCACSTPLRSAACTLCSWLWTELKWLPSHWSHTLVAGRRWPPAAVQMLPASCVGADVCAGPGPVRCGTAAEKLPQCPSHLGRTSCCPLPAPGVQQAVLHLSCGPDLLGFPSTPAAAGREPSPADVLAASCCL